ncbi:LuxR C-terminal-related transcriptional regulator [Georgenia sp. AZ-5]|uniref:LuxR C-terminal-related transcriptional regulator n=1 Tax=Georgenia sp. AZ-5 TaxID=3367526 RepID=UPI003755413A
MSSLKEQGRPDPSALDGSAPRERPGDMEATGPLDGERPAVVRAADLAVLSGWAATAERGQAMLGIVVGEPGSGRTTLLRQICRACTDRGFAVAKGTARREYARTALAPVLQAVGPWLAQPPGRRGEVLRLLAAGPAGGAALEALAGVVDERCTEQPVILALDDLHLADAATFVALTYLADRCRARPLLVVATARGRVPAELDRLRRLCRANGTELALGRLATADAEPLARGRHGAAARLAVVHGRGLTAAVVAVADAATPGDEEMRESPTAPDEMPAPFLDHVADHLDGLSRRERAVLDVVAVAGPAGADLALIQALVAGEGGAGRARDLGRRADRLVAAGLLTVEDRVWKLWHPLAAEAVAAMLPAPERSVLRPALAGACEARLAADRTDLVALRVLAHQYRTDRVRRLARDAGMTVRDPRPAGSPLTAREAEVARLVAEGLTNAAIAERLFLSARTVETHMRNIYAHLGVTTRQQVADWSRSHVAAGRELRAPSPRISGAEYVPAPPPGPTINP